MLSLNNLRFSLLQITMLSMMVLTTGTSLAQDSIPTDDDIVGAHSVKEFSPYAGRSFPTRVLWGDTHLHTSVSVDAGTLNRLGQEDAYRFARGEEITSTTGVRA